MLWRAGSGHRQFLLQFFHPHTRWNILDAFSVSNLAVLSSRSAQITQMGNPRANPKPGFTGKIPRHLVSKFSLETSIFLTTIETISSIPSMDNEQILQRLADTPSNILDSSRTVCLFAQEVVEKSCSEYAVHILHISHRLGIRLPHNQYEQVVYKLAAQKFWSHAYRISTMAKENTGHWTVRLLNFAVRSHIGMQNYSQLDGVLDTFEQEQLKPTRTTFNLLLRGYLQNADLVGARKCLVTMQDAGFKADKSTYLTVLGAYRTLGPNENVEERAFQTLRGMGDLSDTVVLNGLMQLRIDDGDLAGALRVLDLIALPLLSDGVKDGRNASLTSSQKTYKPSPDSATFNILLAFLAQREDGLPNVLRVFARLVAAGLRVDDKSVAALIRAHFTAGMGGVAVAIVAKICSLKNISIDPKEFRLLGSSADMLDPDALRALTVRPTAHVFNALLQGILPECGFLGMRRVFRIMRQAAVNPDALTTQIIISYLSDVQHMRPRSLIRALRTLATFHTDEALFTIQHANTILRALLRRERGIVRAKSWNATAQRVRFGHRSSFSVKSLPKSTESFDPTAGIAPTSFRRSVSKLFDPVIQSLLDQNVMSDSMTFSLSIRHSALMRLDLDSARRLFAVMVARGIRPNAYHYGALMEGHAARGDMDGAKAVMNRAVRSGITPNVVMYTILIMGYGRLGHPDLAMQTFSEMKLAGVEPDFAVIDAVVSAHWFVRDYHTARRVLLDSWRLVAPFPPELINEPLRVLVQSFRAARKGSTAAIRPSDSPRWRLQRLRVKREMGRTFSELKEWRLVLESVSWAKEPVGLSPMLHMDVSVDQY